METLEALRTRRSVARVKPDEVPRALIEEILDTAIWAPNHRKTEPWRFWVFRGEGRRLLAGAFIENYRRDHPAATPEELAGPGHKSAHRVLAAPLTIVVTSDAGRDEIETLENYGAVAAAIEHILLAAHARGLAGYWRTGDGVYTRPNAIRELLNVPEDTRLVGFVLLGYPDAQKQGARKATARDKTAWFE
jgi:nitroreductase